MTGLVKTVSELTFSYVDREARWFNRYNKNNRELEWAYKEGFYQTRIQEMLGLLPEVLLGKIQDRLVAKLEALPGEVERNRSPEELDRLIHKFQRGDRPPGNS